jgi:hypothetical protein
MATTKKKNTAKKPAPQTGSTRKTGAKKLDSDAREEALANEALKLVDKAAALLRKGIRSGAETSQKTRLEAKHQAHGLLNKASSTLGSLLNESTERLHNVINKI